MYERRLIHKDSEQRNPKYEKNRIMKSYGKQEKSRKELLAKMAKNFFNTYGIHKKWWDR